MKVLTFSSPLPHFFVVKVYFCVISSKFWYFGCFHPSQFRDKMFLRVLGHQLSIPGVKFVVSHALLGELKKKIVFSVQKIHFSMVYGKNGGVLDRRQKTCHIFCRFLKAVFSDSGAILMPSTFFGCA